MTKIIINELKLKRGIIQYFVKKQVAIKNTPTQNLTKKEIQKLIIRDKEQTKLITFLKSVKI